MFGTLFAVIGTGCVIMVSLFFYWLKYVYVEKDDGKKNEKFYPISRDVEDIERRKKQIQLISEKLRKRNNKNKNNSNEERQPLKETKNNVKNINEIGVAEHNNLLEN